MHSFNLLRCCLFCLYFCAESRARAFFSRQSSNLESRSQRPQGGFYFDDSCSPYSGKLNQALSAVRDTAKTAYLHAEANSYTFDTFFEKGQSQKVMSLYKQIIRATNGYGNVLNVTCDDNYVGCRYSKGTLGYYNFHTDNANDHRDYINICPSSLIDGTNHTLDVVEDPCHQTPISFTNSLMTILLHEATHVWNISGDATRIDDHAYDVYGCWELRKGLIKDKHGKKVEATDNASNFVWMALLAVMVDVKANPSICPRPTPGITPTTSQTSQDQAVSNVAAIEHDEFRRLQAVGVTSDDVSSDGDTGGSAPTVNSNAVASAHTLSNSPFDYNVTQLLAPIYKYGSPVLNPGDPGAAPIPLPQGPNTFLAVVEPPISADLFKVGS